MAWNDIDFPALLGAELIRPDGQFIAKFVTQPQVVHDFAATPATSVEMHRYGWWDNENSFTEDARQRDPMEVIGVEGSRSINKTKVTIQLNEYTGPSAGSANPNAPGNLKIPVDALIKAQRFLYDLGNPAAFHDSIGSTTLLRDWRKWKDRTYINRLLETANRGVASSTQGGYWNPTGVADGGTIASGPAVFATKRDLIQVVTDMRSRNVPPFPSPMGPVYHVLGHPNFLKAMRRDPDFREVARYPGAIDVGSVRPGMMPGSAPMMPAPGNYVANPNSLLFAGGAIGQNQYQVDILPTGVVWEGARHFESVQVPTAQVTLTYTAVSDPDGLYPKAAGRTGSQSRTAYHGIFFGQQVIGEGIWGAGPEVLVNENSDYRRFLVVIWRERCGYATLNPDFVTVARTYED